MREESSPVVQTHEVQVPEQFSKVSTIEKIGNVKAHHHGIVLSDEEDVKAAFQKMFQRKSDRYGEKYFDKVVADFLARLQKMDWARYSGSHGPESKNLLPSISGLSTIECRKIDRRYILTPWPMYGDPETHKAKTELPLVKLLQRPQALEKCSLTGTLRIVDDWWMNLDLAKLFENVIDASGLEKVTNNLAENGKYHGKENQAHFTYEGRTFWLDAELGRTCNLSGYYRQTSFGPSEHPSDCEDAEAEFPDASIGFCGQAYNEARGTSAIRGAWTHKYWQDHESLRPETKNPELTIYVGLIKPGKQKQTFAREDALLVEPEDIEAVIRTSRYIADALRPI